MEEKKLSPDSVFIRRVIFFDDIRYSVILFKGRAKEIGFWWSPNLDMLMKIVKIEFPDIPFEKLGVKIVSTVSKGQLYGNNIIIRPISCKTAFF
ncbi:MAG: hypothetical protein AAB674_02915 [Patescibacteria group bacterium]